ncbi:MAG: CvpA family protein [Rikenellaceae bacterium]|nr:CvpA family protein [Rikenellaceae bacterium]
MILIDIIIAVLLLAALWRGYRKGFFVQLAGLTGLFLGAWLAVAWGRPLGTFLGINEKYAAAAGFLIVLLLAILAMAGVGRLFRGIFNFAGLSTLDKLAGMVLSIAKTGLVIGLVLWGFDSLNRPRGWAEERKLRESMLYRPLVDAAEFVFPYIKSVDGILSPIYRGLPEVFDHEDAAETADTPQPEIPKDTDDRS